MTVAEGSIYWHVNAHKYHFKNRLLSSGLSRTTLIMCIAINKNCSPKDLGSSSTKLKSVNHSFLAIPSLCYLLLK